MDQAEKCRWRESLKKRLKSISENDKEQFSQNITEWIKESLPKGVKVAAFYPLSDEPDLRELLFDTQLDRQFYLPKISDENLLFYEVNTPKDLESGGYGLKEPKSGGRPPIKPHEIDIFLIPGRGFDHKGARLGRGKGYYDRALKGVTSEKWGVGFSTQVINEPLPMSEFDIHMDLIVTEDFILKVNTKNQLKDL